jgi:hypothetical protein
MEFIIVDDGGSLPSLTPAQALIKRVDADVDAVFQEVVGSRSTEYNAAYADALAYQTAGFAGAVPQSVQDWAIIMRQTPTWAAQNVLATANAWTAAQAAMRKNRLATKQAARTAQSYDQILAAQQAWNGFMASIRQQLGIA